MKSIRKHALVNGVVRTMDAECSQMEAVLLAGNRIESVGTTAEMLAAAGEDAVITDLKGKAVFPGFIDSHSHLSLYAIYSDRPYCGAEAGSVQGVLERLREHAKQCAPGELILGWGYDDSILPEKRGPHRKELDSISKDSPVLVVHMSAHGAYANSKALELAGITARTVIEGGEIVHDPDGTLNGALLETAAFKAMTLLPSPDRERFGELLRIGIHDYNRQGFTSSHEAGIGLGGIKPGEYLELLHEMRENGGLNMRLYLSFMGEYFTLLAEAGIARGFGNEYVRISGPKYFNDGSIQLYTAALTEPYHGKPGYRGSLLVPADKVTEVLIKHHCAGRQITYHGNGDATIECMIAAIEKAQKIRPRQDPRHILLHCQMVSDAQLERMRTVGILPSFFGLHVWYYGDRHYTTFLGPERSERIDPSGSAVRMGMKHSLHADSPVLPPWSIRSIHTAVNRLTRDGRLLGADQRIGIEEAVRAYTTHAAFFQFAEHEKGSIEPGKLADLVVLSHDLFSMRPEDLLDAQILTTIVDGRVVYGNFPL